MRNKGRQKHTLMTVNGRITLRRIRWQPEDGGSLTPLDEWLNAAQTRFTRGVVELACRLNRCESGFAELSVTLKRAAGLEIGKESLRQLIEAEGQRVLDNIRQNDLRPDWRHARLAAIHHQRAQQDPLGIVDRARQRATSRDSVAGRHFLGVATLRIGHEQLELEIARFRAEVLRNAEIVFDDRRWNELPAILDRQQFV